MGASLVLETARLRLTAADARIEAAAARDANSLAAALGARIAEDWPPPFTADVQGFWAEALSQEPALQGWTGWYWQWMSAGESPLLCGYGGFKGAPHHGSVEIGYSVVPSRQRLGVAPEACEALIVWASRDERVQRVIAHTFPHLRPSIRVLEKLGFQRKGDGDEPGTIRFELELG